MIFTESVITNLRKNIYGDEIEKNWMKAWHFDKSLKFFIRHRKIIYESW